ncbi:helix-turn-helix domain-containing protein [Corynebacterium casei]|uniref:helix-turn-helix domain-containing protein n=1 Tax=Actinomycetes TaxID=1760 RepID=UPI000BF08124|nr:MULTISPECIES: helix-turn-helix transcriptional regulator [Actinomycetes]MDN5816361.1 helix-turn-helix domain-containing protein [Yaniella sp.]MDN5885140.1 helix-turn-helix domain-containing protein [Corynebacterium casei]MDN6313570.1 helix-turn-helix domain-containing protein [Corynebacterium casei]MDN6382734.1 helix-turn-helix domain-containing protein [Corynebacterium casei]MDN6394431.1 helix-turn-helix domain-containing protein [Corynebacterium casei]
MDNDRRLLQEIGDRLRAARKETNLSQEALAHLSGLHRTYVSSIERGERNLSILNLLTLATVLDIDASVFVSSLKRVPNE